MLELLLEGGSLDAALRRGWVEIDYLKLDGVTRHLLATTNVKHFTYVYKTNARRKYANLIRVWERGVGWRSLRRARIISWIEAGPIL